MIVKTRLPLVPPLLHPRSPEFPLGVLTETFAVPGPVINVVVSVTCNSSLLTTEVTAVAPLMSTTEAETKLLPFTVSTVSCNFENSIVVGDSDEMEGTGRALPHKGFRALQPGRHNNPTKHQNATNARSQPEVHCMGHRTPMPISSPSADHLSAGCRSR